MARSERGKKLEQRDALVAVAVGAAATAVFRYFNGPAEWWVYLVVGGLISVGVHQAAVKWRAEHNQAYGEDA